MIFQGYVRPDGTVGSRNLVAVIPSVVCANDVAQAIVAQVQGTVGLYHHQGCCQLPPDLDRVTETLIGLGCGPNVGAALVVSLGCEGTDHERLVEEIASSSWAGSARPLPRASTPHPGWCGPSRPSSGGRRISPRWCWPSSAGRRTPPPAWLPTVRWVMWRISWWTWAEPWCSARLRNSWERSTF